MCHSATDKLKRGNLVSLQNHLSVIGTHDFLIQTRVPTAEEQVKERRVTVLARAPQHSRKDTVLKC